MNGYRRYRLLRLDTSQILCDMWGESLRDPARESQIYTGFPIQILELSHDSWVIKSVVVHPSLKRPVAI